MSKLSCVSDYRYGDQFDSRSPFYEEPVEPTYHAFTKQVRVQIDSDCLGLVDCVFNVEFFQEITWATMIDDDDGSDIGLVKTYGPLEVQTWSLCKNEVLTDDEFAELTAELTAPTLAADMRDILLEECS